MSKPLPRCSCVTKNGTPCGRRVSDSSNPPVCSVHRAQQAGTIAGIAQRADHTPLEIIQRLMKDRDPSIRLRAVNAYLDHMAKQPEKPSTRDEFIAALTVDEKTTVIDLIGRLRVVKEQVYARQPDLRPDAEVRIYQEPYGTEQQHQESPRTAAKIPVAHDEVTDHAAATEHAADRPAASAEVTRDKWASVGLFEENGVITHAFGDLHAERILNGEISVEAARDEHQTAMRHAHALKGNQ